MYLYKLNKYTVVKQGIISSYVVAAENQKSAMEQVNLNNFICETEDGTFLFKEDLNIFLINCVEIGTAKENIKNSILLEHHHDRS